MKQFITFLALMFSYMLCGAQATTLVVDNQTPGWLSSKINYGDQQTVENLTVTGYINGTDFNFIAELSKLRKLNGTLNLQNVSIVSGGDPITVGYAKYYTEDNKWSTAYLHYCGWFRKIIMPKSIESYSSGSCSAPADTVIITAPADELYLGSNDEPGLKPFYILPEGVKVLNKGNNKQILLPTTIREIGYAPIGVVLYSPFVNPKDVKAKYDGRYYPEGTIYVPNGSATLYEDSDFKQMKIIEYGEIKPTISVDGNFESAYVGDEISIDISYTNFRDAVGWTNVCTYGIESTYDEQNSTLTFTSAGVGSIIASPHTVVPYFTLVNDNYVIKVYEHTTGIDIPKNLRINIGETKQLNALTLPIETSDGRVKYDSSNPYVASISQDGLITSNAVGKTDITVTSLDGNFSATCLVEVVQPVESIVISSKVSSVTVGQSTILESMVLPSNASNKTVKWTSSNETLATVDANGKVIGISGGEVKITASSVENPEIKDECTVTVIQPVTGITLNKTSLELTEDETERLMASILPDNATTKSVNWTSSDISVAMVSPDGKVYAIKAGQATIMATSVDGGFVALCKVTVKAKTVLAETLSLSATNSEMTVGETLQLSALVFPDNTTNKNVRWTSTNTEIATVSESGLVSAIKEGDVQIIASTTDGSNLSAICEISVNERFISVSKIAINPSSAKLAIGESLILEAQISPTDATNKKVSWSSTNSSVVTVDSNGQLKAKGIGTATIIASAQDGSNLSATCNVEVFEPTVLISSITIDPSAITGSIGETYRLTAFIEPENASDKTLVWSSDNSTVASVDSDGLITLHSKGSAIIKAAATDGSGTYATCAVVVDDRSGVNDIEIDGKQFVRIYNLQGVLVYEGKYSESNLVSGTYVIISQGNSIKRIVR